MCCQALCNESEIVAPLHYILLERHQPNKKVREVKHRLNETCINRVSLCVHRRYYVYSFKQ